MKRIIMVMLVMMVGLSACSKQTSLVDTKWQLVNLDRHATLTDVTVTLNFGEDSIGGSDGCNSYGGSYSADEPAIKFNDDIFQTEMYCSDEIAAQSTTYYNVLKQTEVFQADSQLLILYDGDAKMLAEFIPVQD